MILNPFERKPSAILSLTHFFGSRCVAFFTHGCVHLCVRTLFPPISPHSCATSSRTARSAMGTTGKATKPVSKWQHFSVSLELHEGARPSLPPKGLTSTPLGSIPSLCLIWWGNVGIFKRYVISHPASHGCSLPREQTQESCMVSPGKSAAAEGLGKNREPFCSCGPTADATLTPGPAGATWPKTMKSYCVCCQSDGCWSDCMGQVCQGYLNKETLCYIKTWNIAVTPDQWCRRTWLFKKTKFEILITSAVKLLLADKISRIWKECREMEQSSFVLAQFLELWI